MEKAANIAIGHGYRQRGRAEDGAPRFRDLIERLARGTPHERACCFHVIRHTVPTQLVQAPRVRDDFAKILEQLYLDRHPLLVRLADGFEHFYRANLQDFGRSKKTRLARAGSKPRGRRASGDKRGRGKGRRR